MRKRSACVRLKTKPHSLQEKTHEHRVTPGRGPTTNNALPNAKTLLPTLSTLQSEAKQRRGQQSSAEARTEEGYGFEPTLQPSAEPDGRVHTRGDGNGREKHRLEPSQRRVCSADPQRANREQHKDGVRSAGRGETGTHAHTQQQEQRRGCRHTHPPIRPQAFTAIRNETTSAKAAATSSKQEHGHTQNAPTHTYIPSLHWKIHAPGALETRAGR